MTTRSSTAGPTTPAAPAGAAAVALWVLQVLTAAVFVLAAIPKVTLDPVATTGFAVMGISATGTLLIGLCELAAALAMFVPRLTGLAASCAVVLMLGATVLTVVFFDLSMAVLPAAVLVAVVIIAYGRRRSTVALLATLRGLARR